MKNKTNAIETILKEFDKNWMEIRAGNPAFDWRILHNDIRAFLSSALRQVEMQTREELISEVDGLIWETYSVEKKPIATREQTVGIMRYVYDKLKENMSSDEKQLSREK